MSLIGHNWYSVLRGKVLKRAFDTALEDRLPGHYLKIQQRFAPMPEGHKKRMEIIRRWDDEGMGQAVRALNSLIIQDGGTMEYMDHGAFGDTGMESGPAN